MPSIISPPPPQEQARMSNAGKLAHNHTFIEVGLGKGENDQFVLYKPNKKGKIQSIIPQIQSHNDAVSVAEIASELAVTSRSGVSYVQEVGSVIGQEQGGSSSDAVEEGHITADESDASSDEGDA